MTEQHFEGIDSLDARGSILNPYENFIVLSRYARWIDAENRRETWAETVDRYMGFMASHLSKNYSYSIPDDTYVEVRRAILEREVLPSMRTLMTAGKALERDHVAGFNCSYIPMDTPLAFDEMMYILMCGTGVGYTVEAHDVEQLPLVPETLIETDTVIVVKDSKIGWSTAFRELIAMLYAGKIPTWDISRVRGKGARLKTFGGRASGPAPLVELFEACVGVFSKAAGRRLTSLEVHDICCRIGEVVVVGSVRRSALICLTDLSDDRMARAKSGAWWVDNGQRKMANISAVYKSRPSLSEFMNEWRKIYDSKSGERGIFNRQAAQRQAAKWGRRDINVPYGTNPCSEIILRPNEFCNLSEVVVRESDTEETLLRKIRLAAIMGTWQSTFTNFRYLRKRWKTNVEEERLLGVSLTGIMGNALLRKTIGASWESAAWVTLANSLRDEARATNESLAQDIGISPSAAITCIKPSGTASQAVGVSSGIHAWHSQYYVRTVRGDIKDPITQFLIAQGVPNEPDVTKPLDTVVFSFPIKAPEGAVTRNDLSAIEHLDIWLAFQREYCEHKPSITVTVREEEWMGVAAWVWRNFDEASGISFLPHSDHTYKQAPYQELTESEYYDILAQMPTQIDWAGLSAFETEDTTTGTQELACSSGACDLVDIGR